MFKRKLTTGDFALILVNLVPLYGVWFEGWDARQVFLVYCLETIIIGVFNVLKMAAVTILVKPKDEWQNAGNTTMQSGWFFIIFFTLHYGIFVFVQTQIFFAVSGLVKDNSIFGKYAQIPTLLGRDGSLLLFIFIAYYLMQTVYEFFIRGRYKTISMGRLMFEPYGRIIIQQFVVIIGSMFLSFGAGKIFILIMVIVKILFEVFFNFERMMELAEKKEKDDDKLPE